jgi:erythromycin esterase-like protein
MFTSRVSETGVPRFMLSASALRRALGEERMMRPHRTVGAVMRADPYSETHLAECYDVIVHVDTTRAVEPLVEDADSETYAMRDVGLHA